MARKHPIAVYKDKHNSDNEPVATGDDVEFTRMSPGITGVVVVKRFIEDPADQYLTVAALFGTARIQFTKGDVATKKVIVKPKGDVAFKLDNVPRKRPPITEKGAIIVVGGTGGTGGTGGPKDKRGSKPTARKTPAKNKQAAVAKARSPRKSPARPPAR